MLITALIFAIVHLDFIRLVPTFLLGLAFGISAVKTKSIFPAILLHIANNTFALFFAGEFLMQYAVLIPTAAMALAGSWLLLKKA